METAELTDILTQRLAASGKEGLQQLGSQLGFAEPGKTATNLELLNDLLQDQAILADITLDALDCADPDQALNNLERLSDNLDKSELLQALRHTRTRQVLLKTLGGSAFLTGILCRESIYFQRLITEKAAWQAHTGQTQLNLCRKLIPQESSFEELQQLLRRFKAHQILRIGARDLAGLAGLAETAAELADLASATLQRAVEVCSRLLQLEYGQPLLAADDNTCPLEAEFVVLGMGKLGGRELNFSSDIDLIYFYTSERGETSGIDDGRGGTKNRIGLHQYFCKLSEQVSKALNQVTADGFVFRVDLNLRPEGSRGELANSLRGAEVYYESWGQSWERTALLKGRPVAGAIHLGEQLLSNLKPFIYRRYLDYYMVEDMKGMKQRIDSSLARRQEGEINLKLGRGGIREIEFFIQALQLVHAGKFPKLRIKNSLQALAVLRQEGLIDREDETALSEAYIFLRTAEHRIQIDQERQTHNLPTRDDDFLHLARRCGFKQSDDFRQELERHREAVSSRFHQLFFTSEETEEQVRPEIRALFDEETEVDFVKDLLEENGCRNPDVAYETLQLLRHGPAHNPMSRRSRRQLEKIAPLLMQEVLDTADPDMALANLESFVMALRARATFFALLSENPKIIKLLSSLFSTSQFLSRSFIQSPQVLDSLVSRSYAVPFKEPADFRSDLDAFMAGADSYEDRLETLRRFRKEEFLRIAFSDLHGHTPQGKTALQLSWLADTCLQEAVAMARQELIPRYGLPFTTDEGGTEREVAFAIVAMGKHGGLELNYHSDLDIIFIFEGSGRNRPVDGTEPERFRQQNNNEYFSRLAQRVISALTLMTREGKVYEIDTRLRPSGNQGPLVTSLRAFRDYHAESAQPWERQALIKARVVSAPPEFAEKIDRLVEEIVYEQPLPDDLGQEIYRLRGRMEQEIAQEGATHFNIKTGRGGLVDVEFLVQYLQLKHGGENPKLRNNNTLRTLEVLLDSAILQPEEAEALLEGYKFLRRLENKLRLVHDQSISELSNEPGYLRKLAKRLGYPDRPVKPDVAFLADYHRHTGEIRKIFDQYLAPPD